MRKSVIIQLLVFFVLISFLYVDYVSGENKGNAITWDKTFGGSGEDKGFSIIQTENGGYAVAGYTILPKREKQDAWATKLGYKIFDEGKRQDFWVIKLDKNGNMEWMKFLVKTGLM